MSASLPEVARQCDWVIADENSNVHLPVLKLGIPTVVVKGLGLYPESRSDMYGFAADGVVFPPVRSISEIRAAEFKAFFDDGWVGRFRQYDASYLRPAGRDSGRGSASHLALARRRAGERRCGESPGTLAPE